MSGENGRKQRSILKDASISEAERVAAQERWNAAQFEQLEVESAKNCEALAHGQAHRNRSLGAGVPRPHGRVAGVEPQASPQSGPATPSHAAPLGAAKTPTPVPRIDQQPKKRFRLLKGAQLNSSRFETRYLIPGLLIAGQPGGIFGAFKTLKTSLAADLMISLASGTPFLGRFPVPEPSKVLFLSGESGLPALQAITRRICAERGLSLESLDNLVLSRDVPRLDQPADVLALKQLVEALQPTCVVIDPAYLATGGDHARDAFAMGQLLRPLNELCASTGCTVLFVHHCKRSRKAGDRATLDDLAGSGFAEFSAQWLLLSRRRTFDPSSAKHELWLTGGSRVGHHGLWELDIDEGTVDQPGGCTWKTALRSVSSAEAQIDERFAAASEDRRLRRRAAAFGHQRQRVWEVLAAYPEGCNATAIRDALGINGERMKRILQVLVDEGRVQKTEEKVDRRRFKVTYQRIPSVMDLSPAAVEARRTSPPDQKVYNPRSGHFVDRIRTDTVGPKLIGWISKDGLRAVEASPLTKSGPDTFASGSRTEHSVKEGEPPRH